MCTDKGGKLSFPIVFCLLRRTKSDVCAEDSKALQHTSVLFHTARHVAASCLFQCLIMFPLSVDNGYFLQNFPSFLIFTWWARTTSWTIRISNLSRDKREVPSLRRSRLAPSPPILLYNKNQNLYLEGKAAESWSYNSSPHLRLYAVY